MFQNILVPTDFSEKNKHALDVAVKIAQQDKANINLLHVIEVINDTTFEEFKDFYMKLEKRSQKIMGTLSASYRESRVEIEQKVVYGNRAKEILKFSTNHKIDLIVMNSHKINLKNPVHGWGTISYKVGVLSQCPVMLVK